MNRKKNKILLLFTRLFVMVPLTVFADGGNDIQYKFTQTDSTLSFYGNFKTIKSPDCLLEVFLNYNHIKALAPDAKEVQLINQGINWNKIRNIYQKFIFFENISVWNRKLSMEKQRLDFILVSSLNNTATIPKMISSSGFYQVKMQGEDIIVEYYQYCQLTESIVTNLYLNIVKNEAIHFMERLLKYSNAICRDKPVINN